ncbi:MAG: radical SAM protein [Thermodesulfobacteriota bacterium]
MTGVDWKNAYLRLAPDAALKNLETPFVYLAAKDELYEIDETAAAFLLSCDGTQIGRELTSEAEFVEYCMAEDILEARKYPGPIDVFMGERAIPSLRYLELHLTHQCNLRCAHCYIGEGDRSAGMSLEDAAAITREFSDMGGLRLLISGGEPLLYKDLDAYLRQISGLPVRRVLLTNGTLVDLANIGLPGVHEIQFSLDGWEEGHDRLRGKGTFSRTLAGIHAARDAGMDISFSTMIHRYNLDQFDRMAAFMETVGALEWGIDVLCMAGSLEAHKEFIVDYDKAVPLMEYGFGGGYHGSSDGQGEGYACGRHLMTVMPDGRAAKCGFYMDNPVGDARKGLAACWEKVEHLRLSELECNGCPVIAECRGGCRFRAPGPLSPDPVMCRRYGISR